MSDDTIIYADYSDVHLDGGTYMTELTWLEDNGFEFIPHHYFVDYPGAKGLERKLSDVVGGTPLVRYSKLTVLKAFSTAVRGRTVALPNAYKMAGFMNHMIDVKLDPDISYVVCRDETITSEIFEARQEASRRFGNAL